MCMPTSGKTLVQDIKESSDQRKGLLAVDRLNMRALSNQANGFTLAVLLVAFIGQTANKKQTSYDYTEHNASSYWINFFCVAVIASISFFAGGWHRKLKSSTTSAISSVSSNMSMSRSMSRIRSSMNASSIRLFSIASKCGFQHHKNERSPILCTGDSPFVSKETTENLTLSDVKDIIEFAANLNKSSSPNKKSYLLRRPFVQKAMDSLEAAVALSRGVQTRIPSVSDGNSSFGDMDALAFVAACRIFAEWRSLRLVPDGYPRYAMGMKMARRDLLQNLTKMETSIHNYMSHKEKGTKVLESPTLRQMLQYEIDNDVHQRRPRLVDQSGASGLLWTLRQIRYQTRIFSNLSQIPLVFPNGKAANQAAYRATYGDYHGFFTRQIFQASFDAAPDANVIFDYMNLPLQLQQEDTSRSTQPMSEDGDEDSNDIHEDTWIHMELDPSDSEFMVEEIIEPHPKEPEEVPKPNVNPLEEFGNHISKEWMKIYQGLIAQCTGAHELQQHSSRNIMDVRPVLQESMTTKRRTADQEVSSFVSFLLPFLDELDVMMEKLNMNDPSKV